VVPHCQKPSIQFNHLSTQLLQLRFAIHRIVPIRGMSVSSTREFESEVPDHKEELTILACSTHRSSFWRGSSLHRPYSTTMKNLASASILSDSGVTRACERVLWRKYETYHVCEHTRCAYYHRCEGFIQVLVFWKVSLWMR